MLGETKDCGRDGALGETAIAAMLLMPSEFTNLLKNSAIGVLRIVRVASVNLITVSVGINKLRLTTAYSTTLESVSLTLAAFITLVSYKDIFIKPSRFLISMIF
jgi:hypothetical protein